MDIKVHRKAFMLLMMLVMNERIKEVVFDFIKQANKVIVLRDKVA